MRRNSLALVLIAAAALGAISAYIIHTGWYVVGVHERDVAFSVVDSPTIGFSADTDKIRFGKVVRGGSAGRDILLRSEEPSVARIEVSDSLRGLVRPARNDVVVSPGKTERVSLSLSVPDDAAVGNYTGSVRVTYTRKLW